MAKRTGIRNRPEVIDGYEIEIGATDGFRYIGIKPPLMDEMLDAAMKISKSFDTFMWGI